MSLRLKFLGTGGGRFVMARQTRKTGGIVVESDSSQIILDPGPGGLTEFHEEVKTKDLDGILVSHAHLDHVNDAEAMAEHIAYEAKNPGLLIGSRSVISGTGDIEQGVSNYHQNLMSRVEEASEDKFQFEDLEIETREMDHSDPTTVGFRIDDGETSIGFWTDSTFRKDIAKFYRGVDILVCDTAKPWDSESPRHISTSDIPEIEEIAKPSTVIVTDFGFEFLQQDLEREKQRLDEQTECSIVFAEDGMEYPGNHSLGSF